MKKYLLFTSDLHIGITNLTDIDILFNSALDEIHSLDGKLTAVILCGDQGETLYHQDLCISAIRKAIPDMPIIGTVGNHDLNPYYDQMDDTYKRYEEYIYHIFKQHNAIYLDVEDVYKIDNIAIVGNIGWYDYSALNHKNLTLPAQYWQNQKFIQRIYPDYLVNWLPDDIRFAEKCRNKIIDNIKILEKDKDIKDIIAITHQPILYKEIRDIVGWGKHDCTIDFMFYHPTLGKQIKKYNKLKCVVSGHIHEGTKITMDRGNNPLYFYTIRSEYKAPGYLLIEVGNYNNSFTDQLV